MKPPAFAPISRPVGTLIDSADPRGAANDTTPAPAGARPSIGRV